MVVLNSIYVFIIYSKAVIKFFFEFKVNNYVAMRRL